MVGSAILRHLEANGYTNIITRTLPELDLLDQKATFDFFDTNTIDCVFLAAAKVGGIHANNTYRADFIYENLTIQNNVIYGAYRSGVQNLLFLGSSCIYPKLAIQPMKEEHLLAGALEPTNEPYAIAKIAGIKMCENFNRQYGTHYRSVMPTNLYGTNDNYDLETSHVLPAMIRKFHLAKLAMRGDVDSIKADENQYGTIPDDIRTSLDAILVSNGFSPVFSAQQPSAISQQLFSPGVQLWGTGAPYREFLHTDEMVAACVHVMRLSQEEWDANVLNKGISFLNVGAGKDCTIKEAAEIVAEVVGYDGPVHWDASKPDGTPKKLLDVSRLSALGWEAQISLKEGIQMAYQSYLDQTT